MRHLIDPLDFTHSEICTLLDLADRIHDDPAAYQEVAQHKKLATLFYEPSTRTRLSFEAAMLNLGGHVLGFPSENVSSATKGESVADTIRVVSCYADIVAMRHPKEGAPLRASRYSRIPVINAGDGGHQHPTQTLTDLMTIRRRKGRLDDLTIGLCGDLKFGRTVHSLIKTMARCKNIRFVLISPEELRVPDYIITDVLEANGIPYKEPAAGKNTCRKHIADGGIRYQTVGNKRNTRRNNNAQTTGSCYQRGRPHLVISQAVKKGNTHGSDSCASCRSRSGDGSIEQTGHNHRARHTSLYLADKYRKYIEQLPGKSSGRHDRT